MGERVKSQCFDRLVGDATHRKEIERKKKAEERDQAVWEK
jgi:hypothetical protein